MPESIAHKMENLLTKWSQLEKSSDENLTSMSIYASSLNQPTTQSITDLKSPLSPTTSQPTPTVSNSIDSVAFQAEKTYPTSATTKTPTVLPDILTENEEESQSNDASNLVKPLSREEKSLPRLNETSKEKSENFDEFFVNANTAVSEIINNKETVQLDQSKITSLNNTDDLNSDEIKKSSSLIQDTSFNAVLNTESMATDDIEMISNDLFDWLLWIDHTLDSQVKLIV